MKMFNKFRKKFQRVPDTVYPIPIDVEITKDKDKIEIQTSEPIPRRVMRVRSDAEINDLILKTLKLSTKLLSTSDISNTVNIRYSSTKNRLKKMEFAHDVESLELGGWTYWRIKR